MKMNIDHDAAPADLCYVGAQISNFGASPPLRPTEETSFNVRQIELGLITARARDKAKSHSRF